MNAPYKPARLPADELWEAVTFYGDGSEQARTTFRLPAGSDETDAKHRAWTIWRFARAGSDGSFLNPTLKVSLIEPVLSDAGLHKLSDGQKKGRGWL